MAIPESPPAVRPEPVEGPHPALGAIRGSVRPEPDEGPPTVAGPIRNSVRPAPVEACPEGTRRGPSTRVTPCEGRNPEGRGTPTTNPRRILGTPKPRRRGDSRIARPAKAGPSPHNHQHSPTPTPPSSYRRKPVSRGAQSGASPSPTHPSQGRFPNPFALSLSKPVLRALEGGPPPPAAPASPPHPRPRRNHPPRAGRHTDTASLHHRSDRRYRLPMEAVISHRNRNITGPRAFGGPSLVIGGMVRIDGQRRLVKQQGGLFPICKKFLGFIANLRQASYKSIAKTTPPPVTAAIPNTHLARHPGGSRTPSAVTGDVLSRQHSPRYGIMKLSQRHAVGMTCASGSKQCP